MKLTVFKIESYETNKRVSRFFVLSAIYSVGNVLHSIYAELVHLVHVAVIVLHVFRSFVNVIVVCAILAFRKVVIIFRKLGFNIIILFQCTKLPALPACVTFVIVV